MARVVPGESLKVLSGRTTEGSSRMSKQFKKEVAEGHENIFMDFGYEAVKIIGGSKTPLSEFSMKAQREIAKCTVLLSN